MRVRRRHGVFAALAVAAIARATAQGARTIGVQAGGHLGSAPPALRVA